MCDTVAEFMDTLLTELKGINISQNQLAEEIGISVNSIRKWKKEEKTRAQLKEETDLDRTVLYSIFRFAGTISKSTEVPEDVRQRIRAHFESFNNGDDLCGQLTSSMAEPLIYSEETELEAIPAGAPILERRTPSVAKAHSYQSSPYFRKTAIFAKLLRWKNREQFPAPRPFETRTVGMEGFMTELEIYDEAVLYRYDTIESTSTGHIRIELITSGVIEVTALAARQPDLNVETYRNNKGRVAPLRYYVSPNETEIVHIVRIYNGFQRGEENLAVKQYTASTSREISLAVDFCSVLESVQFRDEPKAHYIQLNGSEVSIQTQQSEDATLWYASQYSPEPDSRIRLSWELEYLRE